MIGALLWVLLLQPMAQVAKAQPVKKQTDHLGRAWRSTRVEPFIPTAMHKLTSTCMIGSSYTQTNKHMYDWILLNTCSSINLFCNSSFLCNVHQVNPTLALMTNEGMMTTNLKAELPSYGTVWFDPQAMTNVLSFGNIAKQYPVRYLQELDTFQVQLCNCINIFGSEQVDNLNILEGNQP